MTAAAIDCEALSAIPLFTRLNETECRQLLEISSIEEFRAGDFVMREFEDTQNLWLVLDGRCEVFKMPADAAADPIALAELGPHSIFGEMSFFHKSPHSASVRAKTPLRLLRIGRCQFDELIEDGAPAAYKLAFNAVSSLAERLRRMDDWVAELLSNGNGQHAAPEPVTCKPPTREWTQFRDRMFTGWNL